LAHLMDLSKESLEIKRKILERFTEDGLYPYSKYYLSDVKERFGKYWQNHFSTIGINGMNESLLNFMKRDIASKEGKAFALEVLDFMREHLKNYQNETNNLYNLEATPAEGTTYRFAKKDKEVYPNIIVANDEAVKKGADPYYTNSTHLPVNYTNDIFEALELQDELQTKYTGGTVLHGFLGQKIDDPEAAKKLIKKIVYNYHLPYFTLTPTFSICPKHGYLSGEHKFCPKCDEEAGYREIAADVPAVAKALEGEMAVHPSGIEIPVKPVEEQLIPEAASANQSGNERNIINAIA
jgi:ribonucleoside-triphosphate reductase (formate)